MMLPTLLLLSRINATTTSNSTSETITCLNQVMEKYFKGNNLLVVSTTEAEPPVKSLQDKPIVLYRIDKEDVSEMLRRDSYDILIYKSKNFKDLSAMFKNPAGNHIGKIVVALDDDSEYLARHAISILWDLIRSVNVIVLTKKGNTINLYSWFPYRVRECTKVKELTLVNTWKNGSFQSDEDLFPGKITRNLNGCPLFVSTRPIEPYVFTPSTPDNYEDGYEVRLMLEFVQTFNMSVKIVSPPDQAAFWASGTDHRNRGVFDLLVSHDIDMAFGGMMARRDRYQVSEALQTHMTELMIWTYPKRGYKTNFASIYVVFSPGLWLVIILFHIYVSFAFSIVSKVPHSVPEAHYNGFIQCLFSSIAILCNTNAPQPKNTLLRLMVMSYFIYAIHLSAGYQSYLVFLLTHSKRQKPYRDISQLAASGMSAYLFSSGQYLYNKTDHNAWNKILSQRKYVDGMDMVPILNDIAFNRTSFLLFPKSTIRYLMNLLYADRGKSLFENLKYFTYPLTIYLSPGNPLKKMFSDHIGNLLQAGIFQQWKKIVKRSAGLKGRKTYTMQKEPGGSPKPLSFRHLEGAFLLWLASLAVSAVVFFGEIIYNKLTAARWFKNRKNLRGSDKVFFTRQQTGRPRHERHK